METNYVVYDAQGEIIEWGMMSEENIALNAALTGKNYLIGTGHPYDSYVDLETLTIKKREQPLEPNNRPPSSNA